MFRTVNSTTLISNFLYIEVFAQVPWTSIYPSFTVSANEVIVFGTAEDVAVGVTFSADIAGDVAVGVASPDDLPGDVTIGVASSADFAGDVTVGVAPPADMDSIFATGESSVEECQKCIVLPSGVG